MRLVTLILLGVLFATCTKDEDKENSLSYLYGDLTGEYLLNRGEGQLAYDGSLNRTNGSLREGVQWAPGKFESCLKFNDSTSYVYLGEEDHMDLNHFTLAAWVYPFSYGSDSKRMEIVEKTNSYWMNIRNGNEPDRIQERGLFRCGGFFLEGSPNPVWRYVDSDVIIDLNTWTHLSCTFDGDSLKSYVNGRHSGSLSVPSQLWQNDYLLAIGAKIDIGADSVQALFHGKIDEVRIFSIALTQEEIKMLMHKASLFE